MIPILAGRSNSLLAIFKSTGNFLRVGLCIIVAGGLLSIFDRTFEIFSLNGADLLTLGWWRLFTHFAMERNLIVYVWSLWSLYQAAALIEPAWGSLELGAASFLIVIISLILFVITKNDAFFFHTNLFGSLSACAAVNVAVKQYIPDSILFSTPLGRIKNTHLPIFSVFVSLVFVVFGVLRNIAVVQILLGIQIAWIYLRFMQSHDVDMPRGDTSDHFAWHTLFPSKLQPFMKVLSSALFSCLVRVHLCKPIANPISLSQLDCVSILPSLQTKDTERRRQKALRDLTERLNRAQRVETGTWPEMDDVNEDVVVEDHSNEQPTNAAKSDSTVMVEAAVVEEKQTKQSSNESVEVT